MLVINACNRPSRKVILLQGFPKNISDLPSDEREVGIIENIDFKYRTSFMGNPVSCCPKQNQRQELCQTVFWVSIDVSVDKLIKLTALPINAILKGQKFHPTYLI